MGMEIDGISNSRSKCLQKKPKQLIDRTFQSVIERDSEATEPE